MKKVLSAAVVATMSLIVPSAAFAATSGTLSGDYTEGYSCDITFPTGPITMSSPGGGYASGTAAVGISQNGDTTYTLTTPTIGTQPTGSNVTGGAALRTPGGANVVLNLNAGVDQEGDILGTVSGVSYEGLVEIQEQTAGELVIGNYTVSATLSCAQKVP